MLKRLRSAHPMLYCLGAEVLFLGMLFVASMVSLLGILFVLRDLEMADDYLLTTLQEAAGILTACFLLARTGKIWTFFWMVSLQKCMRVRDSSGASCSA